MGRGRIETRERKRERKRGERGERDSRHSGMREREREKGVD